MYTTLCINALCVFQIQLSTSRSVCGVRVVARMARVECAEDADEQPGPSLWRDDMVARWEAWRQEFPCRAPSVTETKKRRPQKNEQLAWHSYEKKETDRYQQWLLTPFLIQCGEAPTQPLASSSRDADLFKTKVNRRGEITDMVHFTNIHRVEFLAKQHLCVQSVQQHKPSN